jgi:BTB/POZ domain
MSTSSAFQLMAPEAEELSIIEALTVALTDDTFHDITLLASDGTQVPTNRTILGLRSPVFRKMLFGNFQEATKDIVNVNYPGTVVKAIVQYIHTDKADFLVELDETKSKGDETPEVHHEEFQKLLSLCTAAGYYGLPKFCLAVQQYLSNHLMVFPLLAFPMLEACSQLGPAISDDLKKIALSKIQKLLLKKDFDAKILERISPNAVELVLVDGKAFLSEKICFLLVDLWYQHSSAGEDRVPAAKKLVKEHVDLHFIDPEDLSSSVTASGLVTLEQLAEAYKSQAIRAKKSFKASFSRTPFTFTCPNPKWKQTNSATFTSSTEGLWTSDTLKCPILLAGSRYTWTVKSYSSYVWLGVVLSTTSDTVQGLGLSGRNKQGCYGLLGCQGREYSWGTTCVISLGAAAKVKQGDRVTMTLDLSSEEEHNGTLSVSVNNQPTIRILANMSDKLPTGDDQGFVPAASCTSRITIESIEEF